jgi:hypothetical protein
LAYGTGRTVRLAAWAIASLLCLVLASEARADDGSAQSDETAAADPIIPADTGSAPSPPPPPADQPPAEQPPAEETPDPGQPPTEETPAQGEAPAEPPPPSGEPPPGPPPSEPVPDPAPPPEPPAEPVPTPEPEPPVVTPEPTDPAPEPVPAPPLHPLDDAAAGSQGDPIVVIKRSPPPVSLPALFPTAWGSPAPAAGAAGRIGPQGGGRSEPGSEDTRAAAGSARNAPLLPGLPFGGGTPSDLYVSAGGSSGSSGGFFFPLVLAGLVAFLAAGAQRRGGLVPLTLAPPRCAAFVRCLERPD